VAYWRRLQGGEWAVYRADTGAALREYERELVGDDARDARRFPLLLKFLFPHEKLSVQVHPDDEAGPPHRSALG